jgi:2-oxoglutarate dehydrogenase E1 component
LPFLAKNITIIMKDFQYITNSHPSYIEGLYKDFINNPLSVDEEMRKFFEGFDFAIQFSDDRGQLADKSGELSPKVSGQATVNYQPSSIDWMNEIRVYRMILGYRNKGHLLADTNPIRKRKDRGANIPRQI